LSEPGKWHINLLTWILTYRINSASRNLKIFSEGQKRWDFGAVDLKWQIEKIQATGSSFLSAKGALACVLAITFFLSKFQFGRSALE
jgi:hypothetical protein